MAASTAAERQRQYRARLNSDPERRAKYLERERHRWKERVETGKEKLINELTPRQQRAKRKSWRNAYKRSKERKEVLKYISTPPLSPDEARPPQGPEDAPAPPSPEHSQEENTPSRQHVAGKKGMRKRRYRLKQEMEALKQLEKERKRSSK